MPLFMPVSPRLAVGIVTAAVALAREVWSRPVRGKRVVELGCGGLALPSIAAALGGARVLATDGAAEAVVFAAHTLALNEVEGETALVPWHLAEPLAERGPWDVVLAADVLYTRENAQALPRLLRMLLAPGGEAWLTDPGRAGAGEMLPVAKRMFDVRSDPDDEDARVRHHVLRRVT